MFLNPVDKTFCYTPTDRPDSGQRVPSSASFARTQTDALAQQVNSRRLPADNPNSIRRASATGELTPEHELRVAVAAFDVEALQNIARMRPADLVAADPASKDTPLHTLIKSCARPMTPERWENALACIDIVARATKGGNGLFDRLNAAPIQYAILLNKVDVVKALVDAGAHVPKHVWLLSIGPNPLIGAVLEPGVKAFSATQSRPNPARWPVPAPDIDLAHELGDAHSVERGVKVGHEVGSVSETH